MSGNLMNRNLMDLDPICNRRKLIANALFAAAVLTCAMLLLYPPTRSTLYPACPIRQLLGIDCPGCGATRALAALLHGHLHDAIRLNALFILLLPFALAFAFESYRRAFRPGRFLWPQPPASALYASLAATAIFTIARNLAR
jgi:hypothetical protein